MIITLGAALVLGGVLAVLLLIPKSGADDSSSDSHSHYSQLDFSDDEEQYYPITAGSSSDLFSIVAKNENGSYTITRSETGSESGAGYRHIVDGLGEVPQDDSQVSYFVDNMATLLGERLVEEHPTDLAKYGLDNPAATVELDFTEGEDIVLSFGIRNPAADNLIYCLANDYVFLVDYYMVAGAFDDARVFAELVLTSTDGIADNIVIERADFDEPVKIRYLSEYDNPPEGLVVENDCKYTFTSPVTLGVDTVKGKRLYEKLSGLEMNACEFTEKTEDNLKSCGLDNPAVTISFSMEGEEYLLTLGSELPDASGYYAVFSGAEGIFSIDKCSAVWASFSLGDVVSRTPVSPYVYACESIEIATTEGKFIFTNESNKFLYQGQAVNDDAFKRFFNDLVNTPCDEFYTEQTESAAEFTVRYTYLDKYAELYGREYDEISYLGCDGRKFVLNLNGKTIFKVNAVYVQRLVESINVIISG